MSLKEIKNAAGEVLAQYDEEFTVYNQGGKEIGYINEDNIICDINDAELATINDEFVVEDEEEAEVLANAVPAEPQEEAGTDLTAYEAEDGDVEEYDDEALDEYAEENITMEELDNNIDTLHKLGLPMSDPIEYPHNVTSLEDLLDEDGNIPEQVRESDTYALSYYRALLDRIIDDLAPRDEYGDRDYESMSANNYATIKQFGSGRMDELNKLAAKVERQSHNASDWLEIVKKVDDFKNSLIENDDSIKERLRNLAQQGLGKQVADTASWVKKNPKKTIGGAAVAVIGGIPVAAAAGASYLGWNRWAQHQERKKADPLLKEIQALKSELEPKRKEAEEIFGNLPKAKEEIQLMQENTSEFQKARLITHRRILIYMSAGDELERQLNDEVIPSARKRYEETGFKSDKEKLDILETASSILTKKLSYLNNSMAIGMGKVEDYLNNIRVNAEMEMEIDFLIAETAPELRAQLLEMDDALKQTSIGEVLLKAKKLTDDIMVGSTAVSEVASKTLEKVSQQEIVSEEHLLEARRSSARITSRLEASKGKSAAQRRELLEAAQKAGQDEREQTSGRRKPMQLSNQDTTSKGKTFKKPRPSLTDAVKNADQGSDKSEGQGNRPAGARRKRKSPGQDGPK